MNSTKEEETEKSLNCWEKCLDDLRDNRFRDALVNFIRYAIVKKSDIYIEVVQKCWIERDPEKIVQLICSYDFMPEEVRKFHGCPGRALCTGNSMK